MENVKETFGDRIVKARTSLKIQQKDLAELTGFTAVSVGRYERYDDFAKIQEENARVPPVNFLKELSIATKKSPSYFIFGTDETKLGSTEIPLVKNLRELTSKADLELVAKTVVGNDILNLLGVDPDANCLCMIKYSYDNMEPTIKKDGCVIITSAMECTNGIYLVRTDAGMMIKRVMLLTNGSYKVTNDNRLYDEEIVAKEDFEIMGKISSVLQNI